MRILLFMTPLPPCTHSYAFVLTPHPLDAYIINGRPHYLFANTAQNKTRLIHFCLFSVADRGLPI